MATSPPSSLAEWVVLALIDEQESHGFAVARGWPPMRDWAESGRCPARSCTEPSIVWRRRGGSRPFVLSPVTRAHNGP